jgi:AraC-like DNA-binding protein
MAEDVMIQDIFQALVNWLSFKHKIHICIHDTSGLLHHNPRMQLDFQNKIHGCSFCECAKLTPQGLRFCLKCKAASIRRAIKEKKLYIGECYLGITEIILPVFNEGKPICVIYLGNLLRKDQKAQVMEKIKKKCLVTKVQSQTLIAALEGTEEVTSQLIEKYKEIVYILANNIQLSLLNSIRYLNKTNYLSSTYTETNNWIIESVQNYAMTYYNRDIKLIHLAKLYFINPQYLCRLFRKETGLTFTDFINSYRLEKAKTLLKTTDEDVLGIAYQVGYNNVTYFNRLFKKSLGLSPSQFRNTQA